MKKPMVIKTLLVIAALSLAVLVFLFQARPENKAVPGFTMLNGNRVDLDELTGQTVFLNFWSTSCLPCIKELPDILKLYQEYSARGVRFIGVSAAYDRPDHVLAFSKNNHIPYELSLDMDSSMAVHFNIEVIPVTLLVSNQGEVVYRHNGMIDLAAMKTRLNAELRQSEE